MREPTKREPLFVEPIADKAWVGDSYKPFKGRMISAGATPAKLPGFTDKYGINGLLKWEGDFEPFSGTGGWRRWFGLIGKGVVKGPLAGAVK